MRAKTINLQVVKNLGNYESIRFGGEWELNGENMADAFAEALKELNIASGSILVPKTEKPLEQKKNSKTQESGKTMVEFGSQLCQDIVTRVKQKKDITLEMVKEHYELDEESEKVIIMAIKLR